MFSHKIKITENGKVLEEIEYHKDLNGGTYVDEINQFHITTKNFDDVKLDVLKMFLNYDIWRVDTSFADINIKFNAKNNRYTVTAPIYNRYIVNKVYLLIFSFDDSDFTSIEEKFDQKFKDLVLQMHKDLIDTHEDVINELLYYELCGE